MSWGNGFVITDNWYVRNALRCFTGTLGMQVQTIAENKSHLLFAIKPKQTEPNGDCCEGWSLGIAMATAAVFSRIIRETETSCAEMLTMRIESKSSVCSIICGEATGSAIQFLKTTVRDTAYTKHTHARPKSKVSVWVSPFRGRHCCSWPRHTDGPPGNSISCAPLKAPFCSLLRWRFPAHFVYCWWSQRTEEEERK